MAEKGADLVKALFKMGMPVTVNQTIDQDTAELLVTEFGHEIKRVSEADIDIRHDEDVRSEEHTSELQSLMRISYAVFCLKKKKNKKQTTTKRTTIHNKSKPHCTNQ